jgi:hypothetical protein
VRVGIRHANLFKGKGGGLEIKLEWETAAEIGNWEVTGGVGSKGGRTGSWTGEGGPETRGIAAKGNWSSWKMTSREMYIRPESMWRHYSLYDVDYTQERDTLWNVGKTYENYRV